MKRRVFGIFFVILLILLISFSSAAWWNPFSWFEKKGVQLTPAPEIPFSCIGNNFADCRGNTQETCEAVNTCSWVESSHSCIVGGYSGSCLGFSGDDCENNFLCQNFEGAIRCDQCIGVPVPNEGLAQCSPAKICYQGPAPDCISGTTRECYNGPEGTKGIGECKAGIQNCTNNVWGSCVGEIVPQSEDCATTSDKDCDGKFMCNDENCWGTDEYTPGTQVCSTGGGGNHFCCGTSCSLLKTVYRDKDGDGYGNATDTKVTCTGVTVPGYANHAIFDCDDNDASVYPGSGTCISGSCGKCSFTGAFVVNNSCYTKNDGDCKYCSSGSLINDGTDSEINICQQCVDKEVTNVPNFVNDCKSCTDGVLSIKNEDVVANDCWKCTNGEKVLSDDFVAAGDCKKCDSSSLTIAADNLDKPTKDYFSEVPEDNTCWKCSSQAAVFDATINPINDGDCKKCDTATKVVELDIADSGVDECQKCNATGGLVNNADGSICPVSMTPNMCCGGSCTQFTSESEKERSTCCGGDVHTAPTMRWKDRYQCCNENYISKSNPFNCGACDRDCVGNPLSPNLRNHCFQSSYIFEDCWRCVQCRTTSDCGSGQVCIWALKTCLGVWPPLSGISSIYHTIVALPTANDAYNLVMGYAGASSGYVCSEGGAEIIVVTIISITPATITLLPLPPLPLPPGTSIGWDVAYEITRQVATP